MNNLDSRYIYKYTIYSLRTFGGVRTKMVKVYISEEPFRPFSLSPLDLNINTLSVNSEFKKNIVNVLIYAHALIDAQKCMSALQLVISHQFANFYHFLILPASHIVLSVLTKYSWMKIIFLNKGR